MKRHSYFGLLAGSATKSSVLLKLPPISGHTIKGVRGEREISPRNIGTNTFLDSQGKNAGWTSQRWVINSTGADS
jgi:hypothetical protein